MNIGAVAPALFIGHGNPMLTLTQNAYRMAWVQLGRMLPRPRGILCISAHWETPFPAVCDVAAPKTIHDFGGFPQALYDLQYPAPGAPEIAIRCAEIIREAGIPAETTSAWGLDHGAWCVLRGLYPGADVPVCQLSLGRNLTTAQHFAISQSLAQLRREGIMILGSGNLIHNLRQMHSGPAPAWVVRFDADIAQALEEGDDATLINAPTTHPDFALAAPTSEHYLPILYVAGARLPGETAQFVTPSFDMATLGMRGVLYGG